MKKLLLLTLILFTVSCNVDDEMYPQEPGVINGTNGEDGNNGINCWDLNGNGTGEQNEDINEDGNYDAGDCQGSDGNDGDNGDNGTDGNDGSDGSDGISCWDLDGDGTADPEEDINGDGDYNGGDCQGVAYCTDVYNTERCSDNGLTGIRYVIWIDGVHYANSTLQFKEYTDGTARLCGNILQEKNENNHEVDIKFSGKVTEDGTDPYCIQEYETTDWSQYSEWSGEIVRTDDGKKYIISREGRGTPFQIGTDANNQEQRPGIYGGSGWGKVTQIITGNGTVTHPNCIIDLQINVCKKLKP